MTVERYVVLSCDECVNDQGVIEASTVAEAEKLAAAAGWKKQGKLHFCGCNEQGMFDPRAYVESEHQRWQSEEEQREFLWRRREAIKAVPCSFCSASVGENCRSGTGNKLQESHAARREAVGW